MSEYDNTNRGAIWKNGRKETERHPDFTGKLDVEGVEYSVSAWKRKDGESRNAPALRFSIRKKDQQATPPTPAAASAANEFDDEIPF